MRKEGACAALLIASDFDILFVDSLNGDDDLVATDAAALINGYFVFFKEDAGMATTFHLFLAAAHLARELRDILSGEVKVL